MVENSNFRDSQKSDMFGHFHSDNCMARLSSFNLDVRFKERCAWITNQRTIGPENAHLKPDLGVLSHNEMTLTLNTHTPLLTS